MRDEPRGRPVRRSLAPARPDGVKAGDRPGAPPDSDGSFRGEAAVRSSRNTPSGCRARVDRALRLGVVAALAAGSVASIGALAADGPAPERRVVTVAVMSDGFAGVDRFEGTTRWDWTTLPAGKRSRTTWTFRGAEVVERGGDRVVRYVDPTGGDAAVRWAAPDRVAGALLPGARAVLDLEASGRTEQTVRMRVHLDNVGLGWLHLPRGPREVALQRALILEAPSDTSAFVPVALVHRFVDPRAGVVAEVSGPPANDGRTRAGVSTASFVDEVLAGAADLKIYVDQLATVPDGKVLYGIDLGAGSMISELTPEMYATAGDLIAADTWDFSQNTTGELVVSTTALPIAAETCNSASCGYAGAGKNLEREDFDPAGTPRKNNQVTEREDRVSDVTIWLRAGAQTEGEGGIFGSGESRFCYEGTDGGGQARTPVPLWRFANQDADGWFLQAGDAWEPEWADPINTPFFDCEQTLYNDVCGTGGGGGLIPTLYAKACQDHAGTQSSEVLKGGVVTLPSGHTINALLVRTVGDFCVFSRDDCADLFGPLDFVRTVVYIWQVPHLGTAVLLQSEQDAPNLVSWSQLDVAEFRYGLFPPVTISANATGDTMMTVSWDPGAITGDIDRFKVYWDTTSAAGGDYAFNSDDQPGQVTFSGNSADLTGLDPGTTYFVTVTALSSFANPSNTGNVVEYESLRFPTQISGDPSFVYPVEVQATTTGGCALNEEVESVVADKVGTDVQFCWSPVSESCAEGYRVLGADTPESDANFAPVADTGLETCWQGNPTETFFIVVSRAGGSTGPWGHYGL